MGAHRVLPALQQRQHSLHRAARIDVQRHQAHIHPRPAGLHRLRNTTGGGSRWLLRASLARGAHRVVGLVLADLGVVLVVYAVVALRLSVHAGQRHSAAQPRIRGGQQGHEFRKYF